MHFSCLGPSSRNSPKDSQDKLWSRDEGIELCYKTFLPSLCLAQLRKNTTKKASKAGLENRASFEANSKPSAVLPGNSLDANSAPPTFNSCATAQKAPAKCFLEVKSEFGDKLNSNNPFTVSNMATARVICPRKWVSESQTTA